MRPRPNVLLLLLLSTDALAQGESGSGESTANQVCTTGYIMDWFCIDRGTLLDHNAIETLRGPEKHTVHCLVDPAICWASGFAVLEDSNADPPYCSAYRLDAKGNDMALTLARATGDPAHGCSMIT